MNTLQYADDEYSDNYNLGLSFPAFAMIILIVLHITLLALVVLLFSMHFLEPHKLIKKGKQQKFN